MTYIDGSWGEKAKNRSKNRREYFRIYRRTHPSKNPNKYKYEHYGQSIGYKSEIEAIKILVGSKRIMRPCDLEWEGKLVDVKTAIKRKGKGRNTYTWNFLLKKQKGKIDLFLILCRDEKERIEHIFLIPDKDLKVNNLSISERKINKYMKYKLTIL